LEARFDALWRQNKLTNPHFVAKGFNPWPKNSNGKNISHRQIKEKAEIQVARGSALFPLWPQARLHARFRPLPHLLPRIRQ